MKTIEVLKGIRYKPEHFLTRMAKSKKMKGVECSHVNTIYSLCWIFQFRVAIQATKKTRRYYGYYAGYDESVLAPGKLAMLPSAEEIEVEASCVLEDKLTEEMAIKESWDYNKRGILRKFKTLNAPPVLEDYKTDRYYKPLYVFEFHNIELDETKYMVLDSLTGDLDNINITE